MAQAIIPIIKCIAGWTCGIILLMSGAVYPAPLSPGVRSIAQDPATEFAVSEMERLKIYWTRPFYAATEATYRFAVPIAMAGGGYVLLQSPKMVISLVSGGLAGGPIGGLVKLADGIGTDFILFIIEAIVKTPEQVCRGLIKDTINDGWADYKRAYEIAKRYERTGRLTNAETLEFLRCRFGPDKLSMAKLLRERISTADYSISRTSAESVTRELWGRYAEAYQGRLGISQKLSLTDAAFFIKDCVEILEARQAGLAIYPPYQRFEQDMGKLYRTILDEQQRFEARPASIPIAPDRAPSQALSTKSVAKEMRSDSSSNGRESKDLFMETFESSGPGATPAGWRIENPGMRIAASTMRSFEGRTSAQMRAYPYGGANMVRSIPTPIMPAGRYRFSFYMFVDSANWAGRDGVAMGHLEAAGKVHAMGFVKENGVYKIHAYGSPEISDPSFATTDAWVKCEMFIDIGTNTNEYYVNGRRVGANSPGPSGHERFHFAAGAAGPGGGTPSVFYDSIKLERIH